MQDPSSSPKASPSIYAGIINKSTGLSAANPDALYPAYTKLDHTVNVIGRSCTFNCGARSSCNKLRLDLMHGNCTEVCFIGKPGAQYSILLDSIPAYGETADVDGNVRFAVDINTARYQRIELAGPKTNPWLSPVTKVQYLLNGIGFETQVSASHSIFLPFKYGMLTHLSLRPNSPGSIKFPKITIDGTPYVPFEEDPVTGFVFRFEFDDSVPMIDGSRYSGLSIADINTLAVHLDESFSGKGEIRAVIMDEWDPNPDPISLGFDEASSVDL